MNKTFTSEGIYNKIGELLAAVMAGQEVVIEQHGKAVGVVVPHARWLTWKLQRRQQLDEIRADMDAGNYFTQEQVEASLLEKFEDLEDLTALREYEERKASEQVTYRALSSMELATRL